jgi:hypothetical protein
MEAFRENTPVPLTIKRRNGVEERVSALIYSMEPIKGGKRLVGMITGRNGGESFEGIYLPKAGYPSVRPATRSSAVIADENCPRCGQPVNDGTLCPHCGANIENVG